MANNPLTDEEYDLTGESDRDFAALPHRGCYSGDWDTFDRWFEKPLPEPYVSTFEDSDLGFYDDQHMWKDIEADEHHLFKGD